MKTYLLKLAKEAILEELTQTKIIDREAWLKAYPQLAQKGAAFVTLEKREALRGCIGSLIAHRSLIDDIIANAKAAAFSDPRFPPLQEAELSDLSIEVSLLSEPKRCDYHDSADLQKKVRKGIDGVILKSGSYQATFLPQVWEQLPEFHLFFTHLCQKAGLRGDCLQAHPEIYTYQVEKIKT